MVPICFFGVESLKEFLWEAMGASQGRGARAGLKPWEGWPGMHNRKGELGKA